MRLASWLRPCLFFVAAIAGAAESQGLPTERPDKVGLTTAGLARIDSAMQAYVTEGKLAGVVVAVAKDGRLAHWKAFGMRSIEAKDPMEPNDLFRIYSMTRPITSTAVMILVEEGKVGLDDAGCSGTGSRVSCATDQHRFHRSGGRFHTVRNLVAVSRGRDLA